MNRFNGIYLATLELDIFQGENMRYTIRLMIMLVGLLLIPYNGSNDKAVGKIMFDNHASLSGDYSMPAPEIVPGNYTATDSLKDIPIEGYGTDITSASSMQDVIIAAAVCANELPLVTAEQLVPH